MELDPELLDLLACPACKGRLTHEESAQTLTCESCRLRFRIEGEIPVLLIEEAESI
jgi:uncharacterized protein YbaR (Trm112 family)